ncbi:MAG: acyl-CoA reductase [Clostridiales Family XIII bacterium]|jgi:hypothetical protein|nr:acyl-CoA reductase [Clostridiales Family XIII bacterium]
MGAPASFLYNDNNPADMAALAEKITETLGRGTLPAEAVVAACDRLSRRIAPEEHLPALLALGLTEQRARDEIEIAQTLLSRGWLEARLRTEFPDGIAEETAFVPFASADGRQVRQRWAPLGVLLHIAAGNADALPVFSVIEGLLTGNVNLLKFPGGGDALSEAILSALIAEEPLLADQIYVFATPSDDIAGMKRLARLADGIVVWGGDEAVRAVRALSDPDTRIIEWGHKISFAYVSERGGAASDEALRGVARNICETQQLYCNSCQGIFLDTEDDGEAAAFAERFLAILEAEASRLPAPADPFVQAQKTLELRTAELEALAGAARVFRGAGVSVTLYGGGEGARLLPAIGYRNTWVRPLPRGRLLGALRPYKGHLQTAALLCADAGAGAGGGTGAGSPPEPGDRETLERLLFAAGVVRITDGASMSRAYCGEPHDGAFPLRLYARRLSVLG